MNRYAILPTPGDPMLLTYWWKYFKPLLDNKIVDHLVVIANSPLMADEKIAEYLSKLFGNSDGLVWLIKNSRYLDHGSSIKDGLFYLPPYDDANVLLIEDDCIILDPSAVDSAFKHIEENACDVICSPRHSCSNEIIDVATAKGWNFKAPCQEEGVNFWPNMFISSKKILMNTDQNFNAKSWQAGEYYPPLDHTFQEFANGDTFVHASLQIKANNPTARYITVNQGHLHQHDDQFYSMKQTGSDQHCGIWSWPNPAWVHIGSLSMTMNSMLLDRSGFPLDGSGNKRSLNDLNPAAADIYKQATYWCHKFDLNFARMNKIDVLEKFWYKYDDAVTDLVEHFDVDIDWIDQRDKMYEMIGL